MSRAAAAGRRVVRVRRPAPVQASAGQWRLVVLASVAAHRQVPRRLAAGTQSRRLQRCLQRPTPNTPDHTTPHHIRHTITLPGGPTK